MNYLLRVPYDASAFNEQIRAAMLKGAEEYVRMMKPLQTIDPMMRQTREHVRYESHEWECVGKIIVLFATVTANLHRWCSVDKRLLMDVFRLARRANGGSPSNIVYIIDINL
jgi:hypothetical protein